jgi:hypothetical protein
VPLDRVLLCRQHPVGAHQQPQSEPLTCKGHTACAGCNFCQELARDLQRQVLPKLRDAGYKLYLVSILYSPVSCGRCTSHQHGVLCLAALLGSLPCHETLLLMFLGDRHQVSMGPPERGLEFAELTEFPPELLLADPENVTYDKLELKNTGPIATFFDPRVGGCTRMMSQPGPNLRRNAASQSRQVERG